MEKGILEVGEYVLCSEVYDGKALCEVRELSDDGSICYLIPDWHPINIGPRDDKPRPFNISTVRYVDMPEEMPNIIDGTFVYHEKYFGGHVELYVLKAMPKCGIFTTCNITNDPSGLYKAHFTYEGVLFERKPVVNQLKKMEQEKIERRAQSLASEINQKSIDFQVQFLTDERLCELRKMLGEAYENARVVGFIRKDGVYELKYDNVSQKTINKIAEKITVYTKQNFTELIIEE